MAKIHYCDECKKKMNWPASRGRKKETRCAMCNEPAQCHLGDTTRLPAKKSAGVNRGSSSEGEQSSDGEKARPTNIRKPIPEEVKKQKVLQITEDGEQPAPVEKKTLKITAKTLREARARALGTAANVIINEILEEAVKVAVDGAYEYSFDENVSEEVVDKVKVELEDRELSVQPMEQQGLAKGERRIKMSW